MSSEGEGSPSLRSTNSGPPPSAQPQHVSAQQLQASHPLWARSRGQPLPVPPGRGGGMRAPPGRGGSGSQNGEAPRFEPLSAYQLELDCFRANADGDSALFSEEGSETSLAKPPRRKAARAAAQHDNDDEEEDDAGFSALADSEDGASEACGPYEGRKKKKRKQAAASGNDGGADAAMYAQAAFGGGYGACSACSDGESDSQLSGTSSARKRKAFKAAFPVKGIDCVGCALVKKIAPVEKFVMDHMNKMAEEALWKMAALTYVREVQEPRKREGVLSPNVSDLPLEPFTADSRSLPRDHVSTCTMVPLPCALNSGRGRTCGPTSCCTARTTPSRAPSPSSRCRSRASTSRRA
ncbi:MAG: hypothetical protein ACKVI4_16260 [Actinomycetales bacterium]